MGQGRIAGRGEEEGIGRWRVTFRRHYLTQISALQQSLDHLLAFYNSWRLDQGYRFGRRTPAGLGPRAWRAQRTGVRDCLHSPHASFDLTASQRADAMTRIVLTCSRSETPRT